MSAPLTEAAIAQMREMIASGQLAPGARLRPEAELAARWAPPAILAALAAHDPDRASAAAMVHVAATEAWFRIALADWNAPSAGSAKEGG